MPPIASLQLRSCPGSGPQQTRRASPRLAPFDCEENLSEWPRGVFARPIPLQLAQDLNPARWSRAGLDYALERCSMCFDGGAADRIHDGIDLVPLSDRVKRREGEASFRPQRGHEGFLATGGLDGRDELPVFP